MQVIEYMNECGYFESNRDYKKCLIWAEKGRIPEFMQVDYDLFELKLQEERKIDSNE